MAELARVAAAEIAINAQARGIAGSPDLIVQDLTLGAANLASGGVLAIGTGGHLRVQGAVRLTGRSGQGGLTLSAGRALEIVAGAGLIDISDGARKRDGAGKSVAVRVDLCWARTIKKKKKKR